VNHEINFTTRSSHFSFSTFIFENFLEIFDDLKISSAVWKDDPTLIKEPLTVKINVFFTSQNCLRKPFEIPQKVNEYGQKKAST